MFRAMRRKDKALSQDEAMKILQSSTSGVLAVNGDDGYPYAVPMSYAVINDRLYFHAAKQGHKIDAINASDKVSFCVIERDNILPQQFTTSYSSAIAFGRARIVTDDMERRQALTLLVAKYSPDHIQEGQQEAKREWNAVCILALDIEHVSGKASS